MDPLPSFVRRAARSLVGRSGAVLSARVAAMLAGLALTVIVTRQLGVHDAGVYFVALATVQLVVTVGRFGMDTAVLAELPLHAASGDLGRIRGIRRSAMGIVTLVSVLGTALLVLAGPYLAQIAGVPNLTTPLRIMALSILPMALAMVHGSMLVAVGHLPRGVLIQGPLVPSVILVAFLALGRFGLTGLAAAHVVGAVLGLAAAVVLGRVGVLTDGASDAPVSRDNPRLWTTGRSLVSLDLFNFVGSHGDVLLLGILSDPQAVAVYAVSVRVGKVIAMLIESINTAIAPDVARLYRRGRMDELAGLVGRVTRLLGVIALLTFVCISVLSTTILGLFGPGFTGARVVLIVVAAGAALNVATGPNGLVLKMTERESVVRNIGGLSLLSQIGLLVALSPTLGGLGAALARTIALGLNNGSCLLVVRRRLGVNVLLGTRAEQAPK